LFSGSIGRTWLKIVLAIFIDRWSNFINSRITTSRSPALLLKTRKLRSNKQKEKAALVKFISAKKIGILVSTKHGQSRIEKALELAKKKDKEYYIFAFDTLNLSDLENFPFIEMKLKLGA
jgi:diphthamide biosynthesis enzyme Dph1/Dph2-like protein